MLLMGELLMIGGVITAITDIAFVTLPATSLNDLKTQLKNMIMKAGSANQIRKFDMIMEVIKRYNEEARIELDTIPKELWALAHDNGRRYRAMTTNLSEYFNGVLRGARNLPITAMVQYIFFKLCELFRCQM